MSGENPLTDAEKRTLCSIMLLGCDRSTACNYVGASAAQMQDEMERDAAFAREVLRAEAEAELRHMGNVHKAAQDEKNWRTSVWWLERRAQERSSGESSEPAHADVAALVDELARVVVAEIADVAVQRRLIERLLQALEICGDQPSAAVDEPQLLPAPESMASAPATVDGEKDQ